MGRAKAIPVATFGLAIGICLIVCSADAAKFTGVARVPISPVIKGLPTPPATTRTYRFSVDDIVIQKTRSLHNDTDYVYLNVTGVPGQYGKVKFLGDINDGTHSVGLSVDVPISTGQTVTFTYQTVNSGYDEYSPGALEDMLNAFVTSRLNFLFVGNCDGVVSKGTHSFTAAQLAGGAGITGHEYTAGTDSATGCGSNSKYYTDWSVKPVQ